MELKFISAAYNQNTIALEAVSMAAKKGFQERQIQIEQLPVKDLLLDQENPRLAQSPDNDRRQIDIIKLMWNEMAVDELVLSIAANGFFPEEPLFVIRSPKQAGKFIVIEGNRRLAAVKILLDDALRRELKATNMPNLTKEQKALLEVLPAAIYNDRRSLWTYLSFRHINSPQEWDPYSKAMYIVKVHDEYSISLDEIANRIGDQHETVLRLYRGYKILNQAMAEGIYDINKRYSRKLFFSHWYTALAYSQFRDFLGIKVKDFEKTKPVPKAKYKELGELLTWIFGTKENGTVIEPLVKSQNPDLNKLREVIVSKSGISALRGGANLSTSYEISIGDEKRFRESLALAKENLLQANGVVDLGYEGDDDQFNTIRSIVTLVKVIKDKMDEKRKELD